MSAVLILALLTINYLTKTGISDNARWEKNYLDAVRNSYYIGCMEAGGSNLGCKASAIKYQENYNKIFKGLDEQLEQASIGYSFVSHLLEVLTSPWTP